MFELPSKCIPSVTKTSLSLHLVGALWYTFGIYHDRMFYHLPSHDRYGGRFQFLTFITLYFTLAASWFASLVDIIQLTTGSLHSTKPQKNGYRANTSILLIMRDGAMSFWVCTLCPFVSVLFWGIAVVDLEGVHPPEVEAVMSLHSWFNHFLHTLPLLYTAILITFVNYEYGPLIRSLLKSVVFILSYVGWMAYCAKINGFWTYGIIQEQNTVEFTIFISGCVLFFLTVYFTGQKVASSVWTDARRDKILMEVEVKDE